jgi:hypothetical protein
MKSNKKQLIQEDLERFKSLLNYNQKTGLITEKVGPNRSVYFLTEEDPEEGGEEDNEDFDFGDEGNPEDEGGEEDFDFGDEGDTEEGEENVEKKDLGKSDEFSAADDLEQEESDVEEIDVTELISKSGEAKEMAEKAVQAAEKNNSYLETLTQRFDQITNSISKLDNILAKVAKIESDIKTPEEKLELRSLSSYPFNMKLTDYWETKAQDGDYEITNGEEGTRTYTIKLDDVKNYSSEEIKNSFNPKN